MDKGFLPLVLFTILCQTAAGFFITREILIFAGNSTCNDRIFRTSTLLTTGLILLAALSSAILHLGKPGNAVYVLKNLESSWLSREILSFILFSGVIAIYLTSEILFRNGIIRYIFPVAGFISAAGLLVSMSGVYMLNAVPAWNSAATPLSFLFSAIACGVPLILLFSKDDTSLRYIHIIITTALIFSLITSYVVLPAPAGLPFILSAARLLTGLAAILVSVLAYFNTFPNKMPVLMVLLLLVFLTEITGRIIFFMNYFKAGL